MKKILSFFAAMLVAVAVNAATVEVAPGVKTLETAVAAASAGDVLVLAEGTFYEEGNFDMKKNLTIKAADGAKPVIANRYYFRVEGGADVTFQGIKFDGAAWRNGDADPIGASDYLIRSYSSSTGEEDVTFEDCEFTGYPSYVMYTQRANRKWNSITIKGCYFYSNTRSAIYIGNESGTEQSCNALTIQNSTFANVSGSYDVIYYSAPAENHTTPLVVDHCTFYGHPKRAIYWQVSENLTVTNCIFAQPSEVTYKSVECVSGTISNCLSYNSAGYSSAATSTNNIVADPKFVNAAEGNFNLGEDSPALTAGSDGKAIGDPRWVPAPAEPKTIYCKVQQSWWTDGNAGVGIYAWGDGVAANADWPGVRMTKVDGQPGVWSFDLPVKYTSVVFTRVNPSDEGDLYWGAKTEDLVVPTDDNDLFTITSETAQWDGEGKKAQGTWSKFVPETPAKFYITGINDNWEPNAIKSVEDSYVLNLAAGAYAMKITVDGTWATVKGFSNLTEVADGLSTVDDGYDNIHFTLDEAGDVTVTYTETVFKLEGNFHVDAPAEMTTIYDWAGEIGTTTLGTNSVEVTTVKIHTNADEVPAIKFGSSYVYADGKWIAIKPAEGGFKAGDVLSVAAVFNNNDDKKYAQVDVYAADTETRLFRSDSASTINGRTKSGDPIVQTYTLESDQESLYLGRYGNTAMFVTLLKVERPGGETPAGCDWDNIDWLGGPAEYAEQFKICKEGEQPGVVNIQNPNWSAKTEIGIYVTFPSAAFGAISLAEENYELQGAGMLMFLKAFTAKETEVSVVCQDQEIVFTVYNAKGADAPTAIESNIVAPKIVKMIENGQLIIIRNGEKFNAQGQVIR